jgi:hypothetical protein
MTKRMPLAGSDAGEDVGVRHEAQRPRFARALALAGQGAFGAVVGDGGGGDEHIAGVEMRLHRIVHLLRRLHADYLSRLRAGSGRWVP